MDINAKLKDIFKFIQKLETALVSDTNALIITPKMFNELVKIDQMLTSFLLNNDKDNNQSTIEIPGFEKQLFNIKLTAEDNELKFISKCIQDSQCYQILNDEFDRTREYFNAHIFSQSKTHQKAIWLNETIQNLETLLCIENNNNNIKSSIVNNKIEQYLIQLKNNKQLNQFNLAIKSPKYIYQVPPIDQLFLWQFVQIVACYYPNKIKNNNQNIYSLLNGEYDLQTIVSALDISTVSYNNTVNNEETVSFLYESHTDTECLVIIILLGLYKYIIFI